MGFEASPITLAGTGWKDDAVDELEDDLCAKSMGWACSSTSLSAGGAVLGLGGGALISDFSS